jgi:hypothetical protein
VHLLGRAQIVLPAWEPDMGWRVLDPDGHLVDAGGKTIIKVEIVFGELYGTDGNKVPLLGQEKINGSD